MTWLIPVQQFVIIFVSLMTLITIGYFWRKWLEKTEKDVERGSKMIKYVCIVDDRAVEREAIAELVGEIFPNAKIFKDFYASGFLCNVGFEQKDAIRIHPEEWLLLIDMQMPYNGDRFSEIHVDCGYRVLEDLERIGLQAPAFIVSPESIDEGRAAESYGAYKDSILFSANGTTVEDFREILARHLNELSEEMEG